MTDNMKIWKECQHIDAKHLKSANLNGNRCTSVNGLEMVKIFTKAFGPIGKNWKYEVIVDRMDETKPMEGYEPLMELLHTVMIRFWIRHEGEEWQFFNQFGHTKTRYKTATGKIMFDEEYAKKSTTDAAKKCLSLLGVASDVYLGLSDDQVYMEEVAEQQAIKEADESLDKENQLKQEITDILEDALSCITQASDKKQASRLTVKHRNKLATRCGSKKLGKIATAALNKIETAFNERFKEEQPK